MVIRRLATRYCVPAVALLVLLILAAEARAQITPNCVTGCVTYAVEVTGGGAVSHPASSGPHTVSFSVSNTGNVVDSYTLSCSSTGGITCGTVTPGSVTLDPRFPGPGPVPIAGDGGGARKQSAAAAGTGASSAAVAVAYSVGVSGGSVTLTATGTGPGAPSSSAVLTVTAVLSPGVPQVALRNHNRDNLDRSLCLTAGAGELQTDQHLGWRVLGKQRSQMRVRGLEAGPAHQDRAGLRPAAIGAHGYQDVELLRGVDTDVDGELPRVGGLLKPIPTPLDSVLILRALGSRSMRWRALRLAGRWEQLSVQSRPRVLLFPSPLAPASP